MSNFNAGPVTVVTTHSPKYFDQGLVALIPEYWAAEVKCTEELLEHCGANKDDTHFRIYGTSLLSTEDAIIDLKDELALHHIDVKTLNITGDWESPSQ